MASMVPPEPPSSPLTAWSRVAAAVGDVPALVLLSECGVVVALAVGDCAAASGVDAGRSSSG
jgi:hypothetical protein